MVCFRGNLRWYWEVSKNSIYLERNF